MRLARRAAWVRRAAACCAAGLTLAISAEPLPSSLAGSWRITHVLHTGNVGCWSAEQAHDLVGSTLVYSNESMHWRGGDVPLGGIVTRDLTAMQFRKENSGSGGAAEFAQLGIHSGRVKEVDLQHDDMDITGASTEVPGDSVLLAAPNRIIVSACGVYMEATRTGGNSLLRTSAHR